MEGERRSNLEQGMSESGLEYREKITSDLKKKHTNDILKKKRMEIMNYQGNIEERMKKESENLTTLDNYLKLISMLNEGEPEMINDRNLCINISHVATVAHILENFGSEKFTKLVISHAVPKVLNMYLQLYLSNRNNHDLEKACIAVLAILEVCTRGKLK